MGVVIENHFWKCHDTFETISGEVFDQTGKRLNKDDYKTTEYVNDYLNSNGYTFVTFIVWKEDSW